MTQGVKSNMKKYFPTNLKFICGVDLILFGIVLALHLSIKNFNFNNYWFIFLVLPSLVDILLNRLNVLNGTIFVLSASTLGYYIFHSFWASVVVFVILIGLILIFSKKLTKRE